MVHIARGSVIMRYQIVSGSVWSVAATLTVAASGIAVGEFLQCGAQRAVAMVDIARLKSPDDQQELCKGSLK